MVFSSSWPPELQLPRPKISPGFYQHASTIFCSPVKPVGLLIAASSPAASRATPLPRPTHAHEAQRQLTSRVNEAAPSSRLLTAKRPRSYSIVRTSLPAKPPSAIFSPSAASCPRFCFPRSTVEDPSKPSSTPAPLIQLRFAECNPAKTGPVRQGPSSATIRAFWYSPLISPASIL